LVKLDLNILQVKLEEFKI